MNFHIVSRTDLNLWVLSACLNEKKAIFTPVITADVGRVR